MCISRLTRSSIAACLVVLMLSSCSGGGTGISPNTTHVETDDAAAYLETVFAQAGHVNVTASPAEQAAFDAYMQRYRAGLSLARLAGERLSFRVYTSEP